MIYILIVSIHLTNKEKRSWNEGESDMQYYKSQEKVFHNRAYKKESIIVPRTI